MKGVVMVVLGALFSLSAFAQDQDCMDIAFFQGLHGQDLHGIHRELGKKGWLFLSHETGEPLLLGKDTLHLDLDVWKNSQSPDNQYMYIYHNQGIINYMEMISPENCYLSGLSQAKRQYQSVYDSQMEGDNIQSEFAISETLHLIFRQEYKNGYVYHIICYDPLEINNLLQERHALEWQAQQLYQQKKEHLESLLQRCAALARDDDYQTAWAILDTLQDVLPEYDEKISNLKEKYKEGIKKQQISSLTAQAEDLFERRELQKALNVYEEIERIDRKNPASSVRIPQIKKMLEVLYLRSDILYDYKILNPDSWLLINNSLETAINQTVQHSPNGNLDFSFTIRMDTLGKNVSFYQVDPEGGLFEGVLKELSTSALLHPTYKESISVASQYPFTHRVEWHSQEFKIPKNKNGFHLPSRYGGLLENAAFQDFVTDSVMPNGRYFFVVKEKKMDGKPLRIDMALKEYKVVGREAFFYSLFLPGAGTLAATQGRKGYFSLIGFFTAGSLSLAAYFQAKELHRHAEQYKHIDDEHYSKISRAAKNVSIGSYIGFALTGTIYITEAFRALAKGGQNMKASKALRRSIKNHPQDIIKQDLKL